MAPLATTRHSHHGQRLLPSSSGPTEHVRDLPMRVIVGLVLLPSDCIYPLLLIGVRRIVDVDVSVALQWRTELLLHMRVDSYLKL